METQIQNTISNNSQFTEMFMLSAENFENEKFYVVNFSGHEALNELFDFSINFVCTNKSLDTDLLMSSLTTFSIVRPNSEISNFSGYPINVGQSGHFGEYAYYHINLRPTFWKMTQLSASRIFLNKDLKDIIKEILADEKFLYFPNEFQFVRKDYPKQEFVMQYNETNFDFICWNLEQNGAYFYFDQTIDHNRKLTDKLVFCDQTISHTPLNKNADTSKLSYVDISGLDFHRRQEIIYSFKLEQSPVPRDVVVRDYDWKNPNRVIIGNAIVSDIGLGTIYLSNENVESESEANRIAKIRAEELLCHSKTYYGKSVIATLRPGFTFELTNHYNERFNKEYLLTKVHHEGNQESFLSMKLRIPLVSFGNFYKTKNFSQNLVENDISEENKHYFYFNDFECIESTQIYRPKRTAPRAEIKGVIRAFTDCAGGDSSRPEVDEFGRYKVIFPFDISGRSNGKASCWIRRSQEQVGLNSGLNFPLLGGVEVTISFINGNPNLPIISGALANGETQSLAKNTNPNNEGIYTAGGNRLLFSNEDKKQGFALQTAAGRGLVVGAGSLSETQQNTDFHMGIANAVTTNLHGLASNQLSGMKKVDIVFSPPSFTNIRDTEEGWIVALVPSLIQTAQGITASIYDKSDNESCQFASETLKALQLSVETFIQKFLNKKYGGSNYAATLGTTKDTAFSRLATLPYSKTDLIAWASTMLGSSLLNTVESIVTDATGITESEYEEAKADYEKALEQYNNEPTADNFADLNEKLEKYNSAKKSYDNIQSKTNIAFKYVNSTLTELVPEIISIVFLLYDNKGGLDTRRLGGVLLNSSDANITLAARDPIALHTARGVLLNTEDLSVNAETGKLLSESNGDTFSSSDGACLKWGIANKNGELHSDYKEGAVRFAADNAGLTGFLQQRISKASASSGISFGYKYSSDDLENENIMKKRFIANQTEHIINVADYGTDLFSGQKYNVAYSFVYSTKPKEDQNGGISQMRMHTKNEAIRGYASSMTGFIVDVFDTTTEHGISLNAYSQIGVKDALGKFPNSSLELSQNLAKVGVRVDKKNLGIKNTETKVSLGITSSENPNEDILAGLEVEATKLVINVGNHKITIDKDLGIVLTADGKDVDIQGITFKSNKMDKVQEIKGTANLKLDGGVIKIG